MTLLKKLSVGVVALFVLVLAGMTACRETVISWQKNSIPDSLSGDYLSARFAERNNDTAAAIKYFESALVKEPDNKELLQRGYRLMLASGRTQEAITYARRYMQKGGTDSDAALLQALQEIKQKNFVAAERFVDIAKANSTLFDAATSELVVPLLKVWIEAGKGEYDHAIKMIQELNAGRHMEPFHRYQMALLHDMAGNTKEAKELFDVLIEKSDSSLRLTEVASNFYRRLGDSGKAQEIVDRYIKGTPGIKRDSLPLSNTPVLQTPLQGAAELLLEMGSFLYTNELDAIAGEYVNMVLYLTPDSPHAKLLLSNILTEAERYQEAVSVLESITYPPYFNRQAQLNISRIYYKMKDPERAEKQLLAMATQDTQDRDSLLTLGDILVNEKQYQRATEIYSQALQRIDEVREEHWVIYYARGIAYERNKQWERAEQDFKRALELKPDQPDVLNYLGYSWLVMDENIDEAAEMLKTAVALRPGDSHIIDSYGWALFKKGEYELAAKYLEKANLLKPYDVTTNDHLGDVYWELGRRNEAYFQWKRALSFNPEEPEDVEKITAKLRGALEAPLAEAGLVKGNETLE